VESFASRTARRLVRPAVVVTLMVTASCSLFREGERFDNQQSALSSNRTTWQLRSPDRYEFRLRITCYCAPSIVRPVIVTVEDRTIVRVRDAQSFQDLSKSEFTFFYTVDGLFDAVQNAIEQNVDSLSAEYHPELSYPTGIAIDFSRQTADDELQLHAAELIIQRQAF
jgi:hypothetical protein